MGNCLNCRSVTASGSAARPANAGSSQPSSPSAATSSDNGNATAGRFPLRSEADILASPNLTVFQLNKLRIATRDFSREGLLGEGGFGCVYRGWVNPRTLRATKPGHGISVAVKKLILDGAQGQGHKEWLSEVIYLGQLRHPNLVKLIGYCQEGENRLLVYEYMRRGSLEHHLFGSWTATLPWEQRVKIAIGAARGLAFLHESAEPVIYRDLKSSNILLDSEFNAKLSDFGLARAGPTGDETHVVTRVMGTQGYAAPEYVQTGRLTVKCDVYSFGIVLLELLTGRRAIDDTKTGVDRSLLTWARRNLSRTVRLFRIVDPKLHGRFSQRGAYTLALLGLNCVGEPHQRPPMREVVDILERLDGSDDSSEWWGRTYSGSSSASASKSPRSSSVYSSPSTPPNIRTPPQGSPLEALAPATPVISPLRR